jgi:SPP1 family predicted phage head-tail adaptor
MAITAAELELYRNTLEDTLLGTDTCTIQTRTWTSDDMGGGTYSWANAATAVPCRMVPKGLSQREEITGGKITVHDMFTCYVHWDRNLDETMRVIFGGETYEVIHVDDAHSERLTRSADVVRVG